MRLRLLAVASAGFFGLASIAHAGRNAGGTAWLTWNREQVVTSLSSVPSGAFPLYLRLEGASDIRQLATHLTYSPADSLGCYLIVPVSSDTSALCGWNTAVHPGADFDGDTTYTWSTVFPTSSEKNCIAYLVSARGCTSAQPAEFWLTSVKVRDSAGQIDTIRVLGHATIQPAGASTPSIDRVDPSLLVSGAVNTVTVVGQNLERGMIAELQGPGLSIQASEVQFVSPGALTVTFPVPSGLAGPVDLVITAARGTSTSLSSAVSLADTSMLTGSGLNTKSGPILRPVPGGYERKDPGSREWRFIAGVSDQQMRERTIQRKEELIRRHGDEPRDIVIEVRDSTDAAALRRLNLPTCSTPPCTVAVRVLYRQLPDISRAGLRYWSQGERRPPPPAEGGAIPKDGGETQGNGLLGAGGFPLALLGGASPLRVSAQVDAFEEMFETGTVPGTVWTARDLDASNGLDYWGDITSGCGSVHTGSKSVHCARHQRLTCAQYYNDQDSYLELKGPNGPDGYINMSQFANYEATTWTKYSTEAGYDSLYWWINNGGSGWVSILMASGDHDWTQWSVTIPNSSHAADTLRLRYQFVSDFTGTREGVYLDDIKVRGETTLPNLTYCGRPTCLSGPIYPTRSDGSPTLYNGEYTYVDWSIRNNSDVASGGFWVDYFLDGNSIGSDYVSGGLGGNSSLTLPDRSVWVSTAGWHTLKLKVDATGSIAEAFESDNEYQQDFYWNAVTQPDLVVTSLTADPPNPQLGQQVQVTIQIQNVGTAATNTSFYTDFYRNRATAPGVGVVGDNSFLTNTPVAVNETRTFQVNVTSATATTWTMWAQVDRSNTVAESNENNNLRSATLVWSPASADLVIESLAATPQYPYTRQTLDVAATVKNQGAGSTSGPFYVDFYRNLSAPPSQGQPTPDRVQVTATLASGASQTVHFFVTSPDTVTWRMYAYADGGGSIGEANEANNVLGPVLLKWYPPVHVSGQFAYHDSLANAERYPRCARVVIYDFDGGGVLDDSLAATATNASGQFGPITVANVDPDVPGNVDLYARVFLQADSTCLGAAAVTLQDSLLQLWGFSSSPVITDVQDTTLNLGTHRPMLSDYGTRAAMHLYATILRGFDWVLARGSVVPPVVLRWWPGRAGFSRYLKDTLVVDGRWDPNRLRPDEYDDEVVLHEYGHHVGWRFNFTLNVDPSFHRWGSQDTTSTGQPNPRQSWSEGWCTYFACQVLGGSPIWTNRGNYEDGSFPLSEFVDLEACTFTSTGGDTIPINDNGWNWSLPVAGTAWDVYDTPPDNRSDPACGDNLADGVTNSWLVLRDGAVYDGDVCGALYFGLLLRSASPPYDPPRAALLDSAFCEHGITCYPPLTAVRPGAVAFGRHARSVPNPTREGAYLVLAGPSDGSDLEIAVFDVAGKKVRSLVHAQDPGDDRVYWDGSGDDGRPVRPGVYFARVRVGGRIESVRLVLLK